MKILDFNERLKGSMLIADGAMGSMLHEAVGTQRCFDELNVTEPEAVFRVHQAYIEAGAQIIETNTFGANRFKLAPLGLGEEVQRLNSRGVKIAREARESAAREVLIAGSIGPLGIGVQARHPAPEEIQDIFHEQALALEERGVDFFILETFSYIEELLLAIDAIRSFSGLPIVAQLTYSEEGTTYGDVRPCGSAALLKRQERSGHRRELHAGPASAAADSAGAWPPRGCPLSAACPTPAFRSAKATASFIRNLRRNILRSLRAKRPRSACAFSAAAAAPRPRTFAPWPKR